MFFEKMERGHSKGGEDHPACAVTTIYNKKETESVETKFSQRNRELFA